MPDRISEGYTEALNAIAEAGREIARALGSLQPQIATQAPAERPLATSGDRGTSGALGGRLRAEAEAGRVGQHARLSAIADKVDRLVAAHRADVQNLGRANVALARQVGRVEGVAAGLRHEAAKTSPMAGRAVGLWDAAAAIDKALETNENEEGA